MTVERIKRLDINNRPIFTGIYGHNFGQEYYVENNLCKYSFRQELYRYLRSEGYTTLFYNSGSNWFSYEESQLDIFFFRRPEEISGQNDHSAEQAPIRKFVAPISSPNGRNRRRGIRLNAAGNTQRATTPGAEGNGIASPGPEVSNPADGTFDSTQLVSHHPNRIFVHKTEMDKFFQLRDDQLVFDRIFRFVDQNPGHKLAVVFTMPSEISFGDAENAWVTNLQARYNQQKVAGTNLRLIVSYDFQDVKALNDSFQHHQSGFFFKTWFI